MTLLQFPTNTNIVLKDNLKTDSCLDQAKKLDLADTVIIGFRKEENGGDFFFSASEGVDNANVLWLLKIAEKYILEQDYDE